MSSATEFACCVPVLLLWLGPIAFVLFWALSGGCNRVLQRARRPNLQQ